MSRDKQIEEMANEIYETLMLEAECALSGMDCSIIADLLISKGYRKASDVARETIKKVEQILTVKIIGFEEDFFHGTAAHWDGIRKECYEEMLVELAELKKKYESEKDNG